MLQASRQTLCCQSFRFAAQQRTFTVRSMFWWHDHCHHCPAEALLLLPLVVVVSFGIMMAMMAGGAASCCMTATVARVGADGRVGAVSYGIINQIVCNVECM